MNTPIVHQVYLWISSWCDLVDGILGICTLGYFRPSIGFKWMMLYTKYTLKQ